MRLAAAVLACSYTQALKALGRIMIRAINACKLRPARTVRQGNCWRRTESPHARVMKAARPIRLMSCGGILRGVRLGVNKGFYSSIALGHFLKDRR